MKKITVFLILFCGWQTSLYSQTYYINSTTDAALGNKILMHDNELRIGNGTDATSRSRNMIKIGDGSYVQIGEWEADDLLSFKATKYNFTNGNVGIGTTSPTAKLDINGAVKAGSLTLTGNLTANKLITTSGGLQIGSDATPMNSYGTRLDFGHPDDNGYDHLYMARFNAGPDQSELRIVVGDDDADKFVVGKIKWIGSVITYDPKFTVGNNGNVGIGTTSPEHELDVVGTIRTHEVLINTQKTADFVFAEDYKLRSLQEVEQYIVRNKHLPEIPSDSEVKETGGISLGEMQTKLLQKIEELTLYLIQQDNTIRELKDRMQELEAK